jgi:hypothetical protein
MTQAHGSANGGRTKSVGRAIQTVSAAEIARPLPPVPFLIEALGIASGAPTCIAGYGFSGKTISWQSAALSMASGAPVWGVYRGRPSRVLHIDYEQGHRLTYERYQRLARAADIDLRDIADRLHLATMPEIYLDHADAADVYARVMEGFDMVLLDSFRAAAPSADENSSDVRRYIDLLGRVGEKTGAVPFFIHHSRKPKADDPEGAKYALRGSSALFDACASLFIFQGVKGAPTRVTHEKCRNRGTVVGDFGLRIEDVEVEGEPRGGLRVVHLEPEQLAAAIGPAKGAHAEAMERIKAFLKEHGEFRGSKSAMVAHLKIGRSPFFAGMSELESRGLVRVSRDELGDFVRWCGREDVDER